jgi:hypothetical protein
MAVATQTICRTTRIEDPTLAEIRTQAAEIQQDWTPAERHRRRDQARAAQQRLLCLAFAAAA